MNSSSIPEHVANLALRTKPDFQALALLHKTEFVAAILRETSAGTSYYVAMIASVECPGQQVLLTGPARKGSDDVLQSKNPNFSMTTTSGRSAARGLWSPPIRRRIPSHSLLLPAFHNVNGLRSLRNGKDARTNRRRPSWPPLALRSQRPGCHTRQCRMHSRMFILCLRLDRGRSAVRQRCPHGSSSPLRRCYGVSLPGRQRGDWRFISLDV